MEGEEDEALIQEKRKRKICGVKPDERFVPIPKIVSDSLSFHNVDSQNSLILFLFIMWTPPPSPCCCTFRHILT